MPSLGVVYTEKTDPDRLSKEATCVLHDETRLKKREECCGDG